MSVDSGIESARWTALLDLRSPYCYLALHPSAALGQELGIEINWLPTRVPPLRSPSEPGPDDDRGILHRRSRAQAIEREIDTYARIQGLVLREWSRAPDPALLNLAWLWFRSHRSDRLYAFLSEAFHSYWALELDPTRETAIASLVEASGGDGSEFTAWCVDEGRELAADLDEELSERGLSGAPCHLVDDEVFLGRQHLPMIRWILEGRSGPGPI
jgi:2-hydroxychromene-2-carboxylate isomerase